jgi:hypothetical protein
LLFTVKNNSGKPPLNVPHPPSTPKPKTSNEQRNASLKNKFITAKLNPEADQQSIRRVSRSADVNSRREPPNGQSPRSNQTPEYAQFYTSPYKATVKIYKPAET